MSPLILIFYENKDDKDDNHEYLLLRRIEVVATHGGKDQEERVFNLSLQGWEEIMFVAKV